MQATAGEDGLPSLPRLTAQCLFQAGSARPAQEC